MNTEFNEHEQKQSLLYGIVGCVVVFTVSGSYEQLFLRILQMYEDCLLNLVYNSIGSGISDISMFAIILLLYN